MKRKTSLTIVATLMVLLIGIVIAAYIIACIKDHDGIAINANKSVAEENYSISTHPDDFLIIEVEEDIPAQDEENDFVQSDKWSIEEHYANSQLNGGGKMLWMLNVSYDGLNATDLLAQKGLYLVCRITYTEDGSGAKWYSFTDAFYLEEEETHNSTGYLNGYTYSIQFAVVDVAPDDSEFGGYSDDLLTKDNFIEISYVYYNNHYYLQTAQARV